MGRTSEEVKALKKLQKHNAKVAKRRMSQAPEEGLDYHWVQVRPGMMYPEGWVVNYYRKEDLPAKDLKQILRSRENFPGRKPVQHKATNLFGNNNLPIWALVRGPMPNPEWGPVCP